MMRIMYETEIASRVLQLQAVAEKLAMGRRLCREASEEAEKLGCDCCTLEGALQEAKTAAWDEHRKNMIGRTITYAPAEPKEGA